MTEDSVGYIKAIRFAANTAQEFEEAMALLLSKEPSRWWICGAMVEAI